jgi:hypothetical protein
VCDNYSVIKGSDCHGLSNPTQVVGRGSTGMDTGTNFCTQRKPVLVQVVIVFLQVF